MGIYRFKQCRQTTQSAATRLVYLIAWLKSKSAACQVGAIQKPVWQQVSSIASLFY
ncbi:hypothetical protein [Nostoc sp. DSM 114160]